MEFARMSKLLQSTQVQFTIYEHDIIGGRTSECWLIWLRCLRDTAPRQSRTHTPVCRM